MTELQQKRIVLGISGGIAAYKSAELIRLLRKAGAEVHVVMTEAATAFITPLTLQALSGNPVHLDVLDPATEASIGHIELARWADLVLIAPATANVLAKLNAGIADDLLTTICLASQAPIAVAPAMNLAMWANPATQRNARALGERGLLIFGPGSGSQACGETGPGRMLEPAELLELCRQQFQPAKLAGRKLVITAGPTREALDPVRYLSNHSSGKMGFALAEAAAAAGADVCLIAGPVALATPPGVERIDVISALEMAAAVEQQLPGCTLFIGCAAVADYRPATAATQKLKKDPALADQQDQPELRLVRNPDIIATVSRHPLRPRHVIGFAAETEQLLTHARDKLMRKQLDLVIANDVSGTDSGFNADDNSVTLIGADLQHSLPKMNKQALARELIAWIADTYYTED